MTMRHPRGAARNRRMKLTKVRGVKKQVLSSIWFQPYDNTLICIPYLTENTEVKLKELLSGLSSLALSEAEAVSVMALLREKSPNALDAWHKVRD